MMELVAFVIVVACWIGAGVYIDTRRTRPKPWHS